MCAPVYGCECGKTPETRRHYSELMSFAIIINDTAVLKRKNNWLNLFVWGWVNFLGDLNLIWILFLCCFFKSVSSCSFFSSYIFCHSHFSLAHQHEKHRTFFLTAKNVQSNGFLSSWSSFSNKIPPHRWKDVEESFIKRKQRLSIEE